MPGQLRLFFLAKLVQLSSTNDINTTTLGGPTPTPLCTVSFLLYENIQNSKHIDIDTVDFRNSILLCEA
jgi:hypothetical protein